MSIGLQFVWLLMLSIPVACVAWTITHEEVFREPREYCQRQSGGARTLFRRKFFVYLRILFSHYVAALFLVLTRFQLLYSGWRGYLVAFFALVWVANQYMSVYNHLRLDIKHEQVEIRSKEEDSKQAGSAQIRRVS
jgi:amino acid permease